MKNNIYYENISNNNLLNDISLRKEFFAYNYNDLDILSKENNIDKIQNRIELDKEILKKQKLLLLNTQKFVSNFLNPNTPYKRLLLKWDVGLGKTLASIIIALNFIKKYKYFTNKENEIGNVYVIGYSELTFKKELKKYPEFGFITKREKRLLEKYSKIYNKTKKIYDEIKKINLKFKNRLESRENNGYFKFIGYMKLFNMLFINKKKTNDLTKLTINEIIEKINKNEIIINEEFLSKFKNSLLICDEIHNVYNQENINNWGITLNIILKKMPSLRCIFLSATPLNHSPTEIIDLIKLLSSVNIKKKEIFDNNNKLTEKGKLIIKKEIRGKISYLTDMDKEKLATKKIIGNNTNYLKELKFIICPMKDIQYKTYKYIEENKLIKNNIYIHDFIIPENEKIGIINTDEYKKIKEKNEKWKKKYNLDYKNTIVGNYFNYNNIKKYSTKYEKMLDNIEEIIKKKGGKIFIYHNNIEYGTNFIKKILNENGYIHYENEIEINTKCCICNIPKNKHKNVDHNFTACRYININGLIDKRIIKNYLEKFNSPSNKYGNEIFIIIGSPILKEGYNLLQLRNIMIMSRPPNIATIIQIIGRGYRTYSHTILPEDQRNINIMIYLSSIPLKYKGNKNLQYTNEELNYKNMIKNYIIIKNIEEILNKEAIDSFINRKKILQSMSKSLNKDLFSINKYEVQVNKNLKKLVKLKKLKNDTFNIFFNDNEIKEIIIKIKKLFITESSIWEINDLYERVKKKNNDDNYDFSLITYENYIVSLTSLIWYIKNRLNYNYKENEKISSVIKFYNNIYDINNKIIYLPNNEKYIILNYNNYLILRNYKLINKNISLEEIYRINKDIDIQILNIKYIEDDINTNKLNNYKSDFNLLYKKYKNIKNNNLYLMLYDYDIKFHEENIKNIIKLINDFFIKSIKDEFFIKYYDFIFKLLFVYNNFNFIVWGNELNEEIYNKYYKKYLYEDIDNKKYIIKILNKYKNKYDINILKKQLFTQYLYYTHSSIDDIDYKYSWLTKYNESHMIALINRTKLLLESSINTAIPNNQLPVGIRLNNIEVYYNNKFNLYEPYKKINYINEYIYGTDNYSNDMKYTFKLRSNMNIVKKKKPELNIFKDSRYKIKGLSCLSYKKNDLYLICKKLNINIDKKDNLNMLCKKIRDKLISLELDERTKNTNKKWFYFFWENK